MLGCKQRQPIQPGPRQVERQQAEHRAVLHQQAHRLHLAKNADAFAPDALFQRLGHKARGERPSRGRALARVVVGLVARILPEAVAREGDAQAHQLHEAAHRAGSLRERGVAVHAAALEQGFGHLLHGVRCVPAEGELVVGLLVAARVARRAHLHALGDDRHIRAPEVIQAVRGVKARAAAADYQRVQRIDRDLTARACDLVFCQRESPPSHLTDGECGSRRLR